MQRLLFTALASLISVIMFGQSWHQGIIPRYNTHVDSCFRFQVNIHNSLFHNDDQWHYTHCRYESGHSLGTNYHMSGYEVDISIQGAELVINHATDGNNSMSENWRDYYIILTNEDEGILKKSYNNLIQNLGQISYQVINEDMYVVSGTTDSTMFYHKTLRSGSYLIHVSLKYPKSESEIGSEMSKMIHDSFTCF